MHAINPHRGRGLQRATGLGPDVPYPAADANAVCDLLSFCPRAASTPLVQASDLAASWGLGRLSIKDERGRMGLGSFKALGAAHVIAREAVAATAREGGRSDDPDAMARALAGRVYVTASAGNHGISVAAGARVFGALAVIFLAETVPTAFADRLHSMGADVRVQGADYAASMAAAETFAREAGATLLSDSSWTGYVEAAHGVMEGYLAMGAEIVQALSPAPTHICLQAGVGGLAAAMAAHFRREWGSEPRIVVVEPAEAATLQASIAAGRPTAVTGGDSNMGRLDCKEPSLIALKGLARDADDFVVISDADAAATNAELADHGLGSTPSGVAGLAAARDPALRAALAMTEDSHVLCILSEAPEDGP